MKMRKSVNKSNSKHKDNQESDEKQNRKTTRQTDDIKDTTEQSVVTLKLPLEINGTTYIFEYEPTSEETDRKSAADKLADAFCSAHGDTLVRGHSALKTLSAAEGESLEAFEQRWNELASHLLQSECHAPISGALMANMQATAI